MLLLPRLGEACRLTLLHALYSCSSCSSSATITRTIIYSNKRSKIKLNMICFLLFTLQQRIKHQQKAARLLGGTD